LKAARNVALLNDKLKAELGMKTKKDEEEDDAKYWSLMVPMDHEDKESKMYMTMIKKYYTGASEEFMRWKLTLNEKMKNHGSSVDYTMVMNLVQEMLAGHGLEAFMTEKRAQERQNKKRKTKDQTKYTPQQVYDCAIFELAIRAFDIQSGWIYTFDT
jgi:hypothetical protein